MVIRTADGCDRGFLEEMLALAADWREPTPRPVEEVLAVPALARYIVRWPTTGDFGFVAQEDAPIGAAWCRQFSATDRGYGFVDDNTPEVSIGVVKEARGRGTGTRLMQALLIAAHDRGVPSVSLSVAVDNPARRLYQRLGFKDLDRVGGSMTMVLVL